MVQGYYTLQEAAQVLMMPADELKQMAQKGQIRSFQDRGTLRFRIQDVQELARIRGSASDPDLALGDMSLEPPKSSATPPSGSKKSVAAPKTPGKKDAPDVFEFDFDAGNDDADFGIDLLGPASGKKSKLAGGKSGKKSTPPAGSDSDVRLVSDGSDVTFSVQPEKEGRPADSNVKIASDPKPRTGVHSPSSKAGRASQLAVGATPPGKSKLGSKLHQPSPNQPQPQDSGIRLIPLDSDSDVKLLGASDEVALGMGPGPGGNDSNVRLDKVKLPADSGEGSMMLTEEINLDEEILKQMEKEKNQSPTKFKPKSELKLPTSSPFELSDSDLELPAGLKKGAGPKTPVSKKNTSDSSDFEIDSLQTQDGSSDFDLQPQPPLDDSSDFSIEVGGNDGDGTALVEEDGGDLSLEIGDENEQVLDQENFELTSSTSGIALDSPHDEGLSLEQSEQTEYDAEANVDFDLSLEVDATPRPVLNESADDSDSNFEISAQPTPRPERSVAADDSDSEFEIDAHATPKPEPSYSADDSESSFELNVSDDSDSGFEIHSQATPRPGESSPLDGDSDFDLSLEADEDAAPVQTKSKRQRAPEPAAEESDDFELNLEGSGEGSLSSSATDAGDSDFELNLEGSGEGGLSTQGGDSDSEFELTLDDSGNLPTDDEPAPQVKSKKKKQAPAADEGDPDEIFETDFDVPALEDGDDPTVADSELESSDFDIALDDSELAQEEESGSQVVALDEEDVDADTEIDPDAAVVDDVEVDEESSDFADLDADGASDDVDVDVDADEEAATEKEVVVKAQLVPAAPWGAMPVIFMVPCVIIMFLVGLLAFEMVQSTVGLKPPGPLTVAVADMFGSPIDVKTR